MKQCTITTGVIFCLLATLAGTARAAYTEQWLDPHELQKEAAARSGRQAPVYTCRSEGNHCARIRPKQASTRSPGEILDRDPGSADDPIAAFVKKHDASHSARRG
ncbi:hypothetical protein [Paraburkholderia sp. J76]|uniref:hypothetical protein n=1 Tax=Paraburkholderia sp. J76 TaxID=2805439 RepID=UPI002ABDFFA3|nr:hypothetical protein [Paraburkholderia sp. J76]